MATLESIGRFTHFALRVLALAPACLLRPGLIVAQMARFVAGTWAIAIVVGLSVGLIAWLHVGQILQRFDSQSLLPSILMLAVVLEFGPVAVGLIASSRLAAGIAAELAAMKATEQIDALVCLGGSPMSRLVVPRVLACTLVLPALTVLVDYSALLGGYLAEAMGGSLSWTLYYQYAVDYLTIAESAYATAKTFVFGLLVSLVACWHGIQAEAEATAVGEAATRSVVAASLAVVVSNILLVRVIQALT